MDQGKEDIHHRGTEGTENGHGNGGGTARNAEAAEKGLKKKADLKDFKACLVRALATMPAVVPTGYNKEKSHSYATVEDMLLVARPHCAQQGFAILVSTVSAEPIESRTTKQGNQMEGWSACVEARLVHITGEEVKALGWGAGYDAGDKGVAVAQTNARRIAVKNLLNIVEGAPRRQGGGSNG